MPTVYSPPVSTYVPLATITLASTDSEIVFSSIPASYRDLIVVYNAFSSSGTQGVIMRFNSDATLANYPTVIMFGTGSTASSNTAGYTGVNAGDVSTTATVNRSDIMDYSATDKHKTCLVRRDFPNDATARQATRWASLSAVNQISLTITSSTFAVGSTFSLYGIAS